MKLSDIFMVVLVANACRNVDGFSYAIFICGAVYGLCRALEMIFF